MFDFRDLPLNERVSYFVNQQKETEYWDFKLKAPNKEEAIQRELDKLNQNESLKPLPTEEKQKRAESSGGNKYKKEMNNLVKDIICFTNTTHDRDCYLIFGVSDSYEVVGIDENHTLKLSMFEDVFSKMKFANGVRPKIDLDSIMLVNTEIQVLTIHNEKNTPIYLEEQYGNMKAGCIYARHGDRNTPNNGNATPAEIEALWKKRFNLLKTSVDFVFETLDQEDEWIETEYGLYNSHNPAYNIKIMRDPEEGYRGKEFYCYQMCNKKCSYKELTINYNETKMESYLIIVLDSGNLTIPVPEDGFVQEIYSDSFFAYYKYFIEKSKRFKLMEFLFDPMKHDQKHALERLKKVAPIYHSNEERKKFEKWLTKFSKKIEKKVEENKRRFVIGDDDESGKEVDLQRLAFGKTMVDFLMEFRNLENYFELLQDESLIDQ